MYNDVSVIERGARGKKFHPLLVHLALHALPQIRQHEGSRRIAFLPCITPANFPGSGITDKDSK